MKRHLALEWAGRRFESTLESGVDLSIGLGPGPSATAWYCPPVAIEPVVMGDWVGSIQAGAPVNFQNVRFNPHGNGTHTECLSHVSDSPLQVGEALTHSFWPALLVEATPDADGGIRAHGLRTAETDYAPALVIRTHPNRREDKFRDYSNTHPAWIDPELMRFWVEQGVEHLLIDLPSVDPEVDEGRLSAHKVFWGLDRGQPRTQCTITELIYVPQALELGAYLLELQLAPFRMDAAPSRPILYRLHS